MASASIAASSAGTLYLIGLGLGDEKDITVKGLETVRRCKAVFLEAYTSILGVDKERVEDFYGCKISLMDREAVEQECDTMLDMARTDEVAFLVVGDVYGATTHTDIAVRARDLGITVKVLFYILDACTFMTHTTRERTQTQTHEPTHLPTHPHSHTPTGYPQRIDHECVRRMRTSIVQLRTNGVLLLLDRHMAADELHRQGCAEQEDGTAHSLPP